MKGGTEPRPGTKRAKKFQDGAKKSGGVNTMRHAGPKRKSKSLQRERKVRNSKVGITPNDVLLTILPSEPFGGAALALKPASEFPSSMRHSSTLRPA